MKITDLTPFPDGLRDVVWQLILRSKLVKSDYLSLALVFRNGLQYRHSDFKKFIYDDLAILFVNLVNFIPITPKFNIAKDVHPVVSFFKINLSDKLSQDPPDRFSPNFHFW